MWFTKVSINNPVFATMMMAALLVLGLFSYQRLSVDQFPDINFPVVVVSTNYPGASPETVESDISRPVEEAINTISGLKTLSSRSYEGVSVVIAEFNLTIDPAVAAQDVREKVAAIRPLFRDEVKEPSITRFNPDDFPIISLAVTSPQKGLRELTTLTDQVIKKRVENVRGVGQATIVGGLKREVQIYLNPSQMESLQIGVDQVISAIRAENQELPAGAVTTKNSELTVQVQGLIAKPEQFNRIIVTRRGNQPVYLSQIATAIDGQAEAESSALIDGRRAVSLDVVKAQSANTIEVVDGVIEAIDDLIKRLPPDVKIEVVRDTSYGIRMSVKNVQQTLVEGGILTILIVFLFLNSWRSTVITGLTLPISLIGTFLVIYASGFTLNVLTLMALSLCVGLLIDDAIVVRENIVRHVAMGKDHRTASLKGTDEIGLAVLATTLSIVAVFLPVGFMGGIIGRFFHQFGITVASAVLISMFVSFTLDPMLSAIWHDPEAEGKHSKNWFARLMSYPERATHRLADTYEKVLAWSLRKRKTTLMIAVVSFFGSFAIVPMVGTEFVPQADFGEVMIQISTPVGSSLEYTEIKVQQAQAALKEFPEVAYSYATVNTGTSLGKNYATIFTKLKPRKERQRSLGMLSKPMRERLLKIAGIEITNLGIFSSVGSGKPVQVSIQGPDIKELERLSQVLKEKMEAIPGTVDIDSSLKPGKPTLAIKVDRELASDLGVGVGQLGNAIRPLLAGDAISTWRAPDGENYDVNVRLPITNRNKVSDLDQIYVASNQTNNGVPRMVALRQVAQIVPTTGASQINRKDLSREVLISANADGVPAGDLGKQVALAAEQISLKPGYRFVTAGATKDMNESFGYAVSALMLAIIFIYLILASQFASFLRPIAIMASLPLSLIGVLLALLIFRSTLNIFSIIGFIMLMGLVTKNAILLVDFINQAVAAGKTRTDAILEAGRVRLRPILMTTLAMIFGMIPLALGLSEGAEQRAPMGQAVIGGVITSSILTLIVVPVIYTYLDDFGAWVKRKWKGNKQIDPVVENP